MLGQEGEITADRARAGGKRGGAVLLAPSGELAPVRAVASQGVRGAGGLDVFGIVRSERFGFRNMSQDLDGIRGDEWGIATLVVPSPAGPAHEGTSGSLIPVSDQGVTAVS